MPDTAADQEPSIEEILASIRQIISDDDAPVAAAPAESMPPKPAPVPRQPEVLDLTEVIEEPVRTVPPPPVPVVTPAPPPPIEIDMRDAEDEPAAKDDSLLGSQAATATLQGFAKLSSHMALDRHGTGPTLEDIVRDLLKPMLKTWLDSNLPPLIEKLVQKELDRISRRAGD